jgi:hypothetical protein
MVHIAIDPVETAARPRRIAGSTSPPDRVSEHHIPIHPRRRPRIASREFFFIAGPVYHSMTVY